MVPLPSFHSQVAKASEHGERTSISSLSNKRWRAFKQKNGPSVSEIPRGDRIVQERRSTRSSISQKQADHQLFVVDINGDEQGAFAVRPRIHSQPDRLVRTTLPRYSQQQLTSIKILSQRSAVPAVVSRATKPSSAKISRADKERLLRIAKRPRKGPSWIRQNLAQGVLPSISRMPSNRVEGTICGMYRLWKGLYQKG